MSCGPSSPKKNKTEESTGAPGEKSDPRLKWSNRILDMRVTSVIKEFIVNKTYSPDRYTTEAYDRNYDNNRYDDVMCNDATRVVLKNHPTNEDYIHANWMTMPDNSKYICTQGPVDASLEKFWHMVISEKSNVIVMLTALQDGNDVKCARYFPIDKAEKYGNYTVSLKGSEQFLGIRYQALEVTGEGGDPFVTHHFIHDTWIDHSAPDSAVPTIGLFKLAKKLAGGASITVHSSAGIGRAATFVGIDYASQKIRVDGDFNMVDVIKDLRGQRLQAIQTGVQYLFLHMCLLELYAEEGVLRRQGRYEGFVAYYQKLLKKFAEKNAEKSVAKQM